MTLSEFQRLIERIYLEKDSARGLDGSFMWFVEEVGELAAALRGGDDKEIAGEFADCLAWLATLASIAGADLEKAALKYAHGCPGCRAAPCRCKSAKP